ncbi:hypothetical protein Dimus_023634 [Dionaea muscipula]
MFGRSVLLALTALSACAATTPPGPAQSGQAGAYGNFLVGQYAASRFDFPRAANAMRQALSDDPAAAPALSGETFLLELLAGNAATASAIATTLPKDSLAQLLLAGSEARAGHWHDALRRYQALPTPDALTSVLKPLLVAWAQRSAGDTRAALTTLQTQSNPGARTIFALHTALIADQGKMVAIAAQNYGIVQGGLSVTNLRLSELLASWDARTGDMTSANQVLDGLSPDLAMAMTLPALKKQLMTPPVGNAVQGLAEVFVNLAAALEDELANSPQRGGQPAGQQTVMTMLQLGLQLRPDLTPARLLLSEVVDKGDNASVALAPLQAIGPSDPLYPLAALREAVLLARLGQNDQAQSLLQQLAQLYPWSPEPLLAQADLLRQEQKFAAAIPLYTKALPLLSAGSSANWVLYYDRAMCYDQSGDWPHAQADLEQALKLSPGQPYVLNYLGYSWAVKKENMAKARAMIEQALQSRLRSASAGPGAGGGADTDPGGEADSRGPDHQCASGRRLCGGGRASAGRLPVAPGPAAGPAERFAEPASRQAAAQIGQPSRQQLSLSAVMPSKSESLGFAPAKVNLTLRVTGRRPDGYHLLDSLVVFADIGDRLSVSAGSGLSLTVTGPFGGPLAAEPDNLVLRAARLLAEAAGIAPNASLVLEKNLPIASGIGGGSSDAAAALRLLSDAWGLSRDAVRHAGNRLAARGGCAGLPGAPGRAHGRHRRGSLRRADTAALGAAPRQSRPVLPDARDFRARMATGAGFSPADAVPAEGFATASDFARALAASGNDLEEPAITVTPAIADVLAALRAAPDVLLARMSGSGATCFGLFPAPADAAAAAAAMRRDGWWVWGEGFTSRPLAPYEHARRPSPRFRVRRFRVLGRSQAVRQRILIPPCGGSDPPAPARQTNPASGCAVESAARPRAKRKGTLRCPFAINSNDNSLWDGYCPSPSGGACSACDCSSNRHAPRAACRRRCRRGRAASARSADRFSQSFSCLLSTSEPAI